MAQMNSAITDIPIRGIHLPEAIGWWPPAIGWWMLIISLLLFVVCAALFKVIYTRRRFKRSAQSGFNKVVADYQQIMDPIIYVQNLSVYLRQTAMHFYSREHVASLTGSKWLQFLDQTKKVDKEKNLSAQFETKFQSEVGQLLLTTPYNPNTSIDPKLVEQLTRLVELWVAALPVASKNVPSQVE